MPRKSNILKKGGKGKWADSIVPFDNVTRAYMTPQALKEHANKEHNYEDKIFENQKTLNEAMNHEEELVKEETKGLKEKYLNKQTNDSKNYATDQTIRQRYWSLYIGIFSNIIGFFSNKLSSIIAWITGLITKISISTGSYGVDTFLSTIKNFFRQREIISAILYILFFGIIFGLIGTGIGLGVTQLNKPNIDARDMTVKNSKYYDDKTNPLQTIQTTITTYSKKTTDTFQSFLDFLESIPFIKKIILLFKRIQYSLQYGDSFLSTTDRVSNSGRCDSIINIEGSMLKDNFEDGTIPIADKIYTINYPKPLKMNMSDVINQDLNVLPSKVKESLVIGNEELTFKWKKNETDGGIIKYDLECDPYTKENIQLGIFQEGSSPNKCKLIKKYFEKANTDTDNPKYYDGRKLRLSKSPDLQSYYS
jgi:hypothetical protein